MDILTVWVYLHSGFSGRLQKTRILKQCITAVEDHPKLFILAAIESAYATSY